MGAGQIIRRISAPARLTLLAAVATGMCGSSAAMAEYASPGQITPSVVNFGNVHVGDAFGTQALTVQNIAPVGSEYLKTLLMPTAGSQFLVSGGTSVNQPGMMFAKLFGPLAPQMSDSSAIVYGGSGATATAGLKTGSLIAMFGSDNGAGTVTELSQSQTITVQGNVYRYAQANSFAGPPSNMPTLNLGIVHKGESFTSQALGISNVAASDGFSEKLNALPVYTDGAASASGSISGLAAGSSSTAISVGLGNANTNIAGMKSGIVGVALQSDGTGTSNLGITNIGSQGLIVEGQVNDYASAALTHAGAGSFGGSGMSYTLDFGSIVQGSGSALALLSVLNVGGSASFTDVLNGSFYLPGGTDFQLSGFDAFSGIAGGSSTGPLSITLSDATVGTFSQTLYLNWHGSNGSGYAGPGSQIMLNLSGSVVAAVPEPATYGMMLAGLGLVGFMVRRRKQAEA